MRIPPGFSTVTPYFFVDGADRFIQFMVRGLGAVEIDRHMNGAHIANAQVRLGTSTVMVADAIPEYPAMPDGQLHIISTVERQMLSYTPHYPQLTHYSKETQKYSSVF